MDCKLLLPASTIQYIVIEINNIHEKGQEIVQQKLQESFLAEKISSDKINQIIKTFSNVILGLKVITSFEQKKIL